MRTLTFGLTLVGFTLAAVGCGSDSDGGSEPEPRSVDPKSAAVRAAVQSNASVALKLHSVLREQSGNLFYSPLSIEAVLGILTLDRPFLFFIRDNLTGAILFTGRVADPTEG